ncbi:MAG: hypothetical protein K2X87_11340 [Gemmataceae bacterium]|nr:hypothetical protein [Gemmataceae bacterium]
MRRFAALLLGGSAVLAGVVAGLAPAVWWSGGHESITEAAAARLPDDVPAFFRRGGKLLAHFSGDPDRWKNREAKFLRRAEEGNHFLDLEDLDGKELPGTNRFDGQRLIYYKLKKDPSRVGLLPYAILENYERLMVGFYDHRQTPNVEAVPMKCLVAGGVLAHYTADAAMPLHTTRDYDGRPQPGGGFKQKGVHARLDAFPEKNGIGPEEITRGLEAKVIGDVWAHVMKFIAESHAEVDKCYELDAVKAFENPTDESRAFVLTRCRAGAQLTLDLWYTAWVRSEKLPPHW